MPPHWELCLACDPSVDVRDGVLRSGSILVYGDGDEVRIPDCCGTRYVVVWVAMEAFGTERKWKLVYLLRHAPVFPGTQYTGGSCDNVEVACECSPIPRALTVTLKNVAFCDCIHNVSGPLNYNDATGKWEASLSVPCGAGATLGVTLNCNATPQWTWTLSGCSTEGGTFALIQCSPLLLRTTNITTAGSECCDHPSGSFNLEIS